MKKLIGISLLASLVSGYSSAGELFCSGKVDSVRYHGNNKLMVKLSSMNTAVFICNPETEWSVPGATGQVMGPETCKTVFSMLLSARVSGQEIEKIYFDGDDVPTSCNNWEGWKSAFVRYVVL